ncbi:MAG: hypothetical protein ABL897_03260, partial [Hyphomicrobium sp.]
FKPEYIDRVKRYALMAPNNHSIAILLGVTQEQLNKWMKAFPEFREAIVNTRAEGQRQLQRALKRRGTGFHVKTEKIYLTREGDIVRAPTTEYIPPDTGALIFALKAAERGRFNDKIEDGPPDAKGKRPSAGKPGEGAGIHIHFDTEALALAGVTPHATRDEPDDADPDEPEGEAE